MDVVNVQEWIVALLLLACGIFVFRRAYALYKKSKQKGGCCCNCTSNCGLKDLQKNCSQESCNKKSTEEKK